MNVVRRWKRFLVCSDNHGHLADRRVLKELLSFKCAFRPEVVIHAGDCIDLSCLRSGASESDLSVDPESDLSDGLSFLAQLEPQHYLLGNHEHRLVALMNHPRAIVSALACRIYSQITDQCKRNKVKVYPYDLRSGFIQIGDAIVQHGFMHNLSAAQHAAEQMCHGSARKLIMGHVHRSGVSEGRRIGGVTGYSLGWLGDPALATYASNRVASTMWSRGWAFGEFVDGKRPETQIFQIKELQNGTFRVPPWIKLS